MRYLAILCVGALVLLSGCSSHTSRRPMARGKSNVQGVDTKQLPDVRDIRTAPDAMPAPEPLIVGMPPLPRLPQALQRPKFPEPMEFKARASTEFDARKMAFDRAREELATILLQLYPDLNWVPENNDLEKARIVQTVSTKEGESENFGKYFEVYVRLALNDETMQEIRTLARAKAVEQRQHLGLIGLMAAMAVVAVIGGYLRLEEMTRGFYTGLLRIVAVAVLALAATGLWRLH